MVDRHWPDIWDWSALLLYAAFVVLGPALGYWLLVVDIRRYLRALRGALVRVCYYFPEVPIWAQRETPGCLVALGLRLPCSINDVKRAYRRLAKELHPDRGGDRHRFMQLQRNCEAALAFLRQVRAGDPDAEAEPTAS
jgi:hypothetical protein